MDVEGCGRFVVGGVVKVVSNRGGVASGGIVGIIVVEWHGRVGEVEFVEFVVGGVVEVFASVCGGVACSGIVESWVHVDDGVESSGKVE